MCDFCPWVNNFLTKSKIEADKVINERNIVPARRDPVVIVHGGAGRIPEMNRKIMLEEVKRAAIESYKNLIRGSHALDAVEESISYMESKKYFNCAFGGSLNYNGNIITDAGIMDGNNEIGCVGAVKDVIEHPISLARLVLHNTDHILIVEKGAESFASESGVPILSPGALIPEKTPPPSIHTSENEDQDSENEKTNNRIKNSEQTIDEKNDSEDEIVVIKRFPQCSPFYGEIIEEKYKPEEELSDIFEPTVLEIGGVGAVAYDRKGRLATGTSTSGNQGKLNGYMSPVATVPGCGIYANENGCVSVSGDDPTIYAYAPSRMFIKRLDRGEIVEEALNTEIDKFQNIMSQSNIGAIAINSIGEPAVSFRSKHFPWAYCKLGEIYYGCNKNEIFLEKIEGLDRPLDCMCEGVI